MTADETLLQQPSPGTLGDRERRPWPGQPTPPEADTQRVIDDTYDTRALRADRRLVGQVLARLLTDPPVDDDGWVFSPGRYVAVSGEHAAAIERTIEAGR